MTTTNDRAPRRRRKGRAALLAGAALLAAFGAPVVAARPASAAGYCTTESSASGPAKAYCSPGIKARYKVGASCANGRRYYGRVVGSGDVSRTKVSCPGGWHWVDIIHV